MGIINVQEMLNELITGSDLRTFTSKISLLTNLSLIITDSKCHILASSKVSQELAEAIWISPSQTMQDKISCLLLTEKKEFPVLQFVISGSPKDLGYLYILINEVSEGYRILDLHKFGEDAALVFGLQLRKQNELTAIHNQYKEMFIFDLLYGNIDYVEDIIAKSKLWGWDLDQPIGVMVFDLDNYERFSRDPMILEELTKHIQKIMRSDFKDKLNLWSKNFPIMVINDELIMMLPMSTTNKLVYKSLITQLIQLLLPPEQIFLDRMVRIGIGRVYSTPLDIFRSYQEAKSAIQLGKFSAASNLIFFADLGLAQILYNHDAYELNTFYQETLGDLEQYDQAHDSQLTSTLEKYLELNCDLQATAGILYLHRNTLRYRLKRISKILSCEIENFETKLNLVAALKIKYLAKVLKQNSYLNDR